MGKGQMCRIIEFTEYYTFMLIYAYLMFEYIYIYIRPVNNTIEQTLIKLYSYIYIHIIRVHTAIAK